jgi:hypothetical protein
VLVSLVLDSVQCPVDSGKCCGVYYYNYLIRVGLDNLDLKFGVATFSNVSEVII